MDARNALPFQLKTAMLGVGGALLMVGGVLWFSHWNTERLVEAAELREHTDTVIGEIRALLAHLADADAGARGFVITGDKGFLEPCESAARQVRGHLVNLRALTADDPAQQDRLATLGPIARAGIDRMAELIELRREKGFGPAAAFVRSSRDEKLMDDARALVGEMEQEEIHRLAERDLLVKVGTARADLALLAGAALSVGLLVGALFLLGGGIRGRSEGVAPHRAHDRTRTEEEVQELHKALERHAAELEVAHKELEAFSYAVSHDLRVALQRVLGSADLLQRHSASALDETGRQYLVAISESAGPMTRMIDDLLRLSRMRRGKMQRTTVALGPLVSQVLGDLEEEIQGRRIDWRIGPLPDVEGDAELLRLVFLQLVSNALKYTSTRPEARIEIGTGPPDGETVVFVRDNGVGFYMQYAHGVLQRLHDSDDLEGAGIALANVRRIIQRHGGRTWAEGEVDRRTTFYISFPDQGTGTAAPTHGLEHEKVG